MNHSFDVIAVLSETWLNEDINFMKQYILSAS